jgi:hypothetical protein
MLCPYGLTRVDLKLWGSPRRTVATKKVCEQTQHAQRVASLAVVVILAVCCRYEEMLTRRSVPLYNA